MYSLLDTESHKYNDPPEYSGDHRSPTPSPPDVDEARTSDLYSSSINQSQRSTNTSVLYSPSSQGSTETHLSEVYDHWKTEDYSRSFEFPAPTPGNDPETTTTQPRAPRFLQPRYRRPYYQRSQPATNHPHPVKQRRFRSSSRSFEGLSNNHYQQQQPNNNKTVARPAVRPSRYGRRRRMKTAKKNVGQVYDKKTNSTIELIEIDPSYFEWVKKYERGFESNIPDQTLYHQTKNRAKDLLMKTKDSKNGRIRV